MPGHSRPKDGVLSHAYVPAMTTHPKVRPCHFAAPSDWCRSRAPGQRVL